MKKVQRITFLLSACFLATANFVQSTSFSGTYLTSSEDGSHRFRDIEPNGLVVNYEYFPLQSTRHKRQVEEKVAKPAENSSSRNKATETSQSATNSSVVQTPVTTSSLPNPKPTTTNVQNNTTPLSVSPSSVTPIVSITQENVTFPLNQSIFSKIDEEFPNYPFFNANATTPPGLQIQNETHKYYTSTTVQNGSVYWLNLDDLSEAQEHDVLSSAHRRAATLKLKFSFPFYGHIIENVTVATGGFIYLGEQVHAWLAATQYVAPLMANFDSSLSDNSSVRYVSSGTHFTVEWRNVHLKDSPEKGPFTFQTSLYQNGTIVFVYKTLPLSITSINDQAHPVKVGLSDAYIREKHILFVKQKTIYEYDRVDLKNQFIDNGTAIVFTPQITCLNFKTCHDCATHNTSFECTWCSASNRCSDGTDRFRDDWIVQSCDRNNVTTHERCSNGSSNTYILETNTARSSQVNLKVDPNNDHVDKSAIHQHSSAEEGMSTAGVIGVLFLVMLVLTGAGWIFYGYIFPHSTSGQLLIRYRPSQWRFRRGEARYTAASIHM